MYNLNKINTLIAEKKLTKVWLAKQIGMSEGGLKKLIKTNSTKQKTLEKIAKVLEVPFDYFGESDQREPLVERKKNRIFIQIELEEHQGEDVLKMLFGKEFFNLLKK